ncbi:hypothetical protein [Actinoplanes sp. NPDC026670]|uniref:hypothetical protein n=1 Tax=Actinoplanes sp. NPDC026670 TaxID=3154700 RepID=UPI0033E0BF40
MDETLGVLAHHGGLIAEHPVLTVGILRAVARPGGLELELMARRPPGRARSAPTPRNLLPPYDEGLDLRIAWLDETGRARWEYPAGSSSSSGAHGHNLQLLMRLPPMFDRLSLVLAWPEIGFPETVVDLPLPSRATVDRDTVSIWDAPVRTTRPPAALTYRSGDFAHSEPDAETGRMIAPPQVLARTSDAVVVLNRLTGIGDTLSFELVCLAAADIPHDLTRIAGASVAVVQGAEAVWARSHTASASGGDSSFESAAEYTVARPAGDVLHLLISWPESGLPDTVVAIPLNAG